MNKTPALLIELLPRTHRVCASTISKWLKEKDMPQTYEKPDPGSTVGMPPATPRWVKVFGVVFIVIAVLVGIVLLAESAGISIHAVPIDHGAQQ
jgi:hypothetical protein